jgi:hypothetical protein
MRRDVAAAHAASMLLFLFVPAALFLRIGGNEYT